MSMYCHACGKTIEEDRLSLCHACHCKTPWRCPECLSTDTGDAALATYMDSVCKRCGHRWLHPTGEGAGQ